MTRKERYDLHKSQRRCGSCGKQDERTIAGKAVCKTCADRININSMKRYNNLSDLGLCVVCGKETAAVGKLCKSCSDKAKIRDMRRTKRFQSVIQV